MNFWKIFLFFEFHLYADDTHIYPIFQPNCSHVYKISKYGWLKTS